MRKSTASPKLIDRLNQTISLPGDSKEDLVIKQVWFALAIAALLYPFVEVIILASHGVYDYWYLRGSLAFCIAVLIVYFLWKRKHTAQLGFLLSLVIVSFCGILQYLYGGLLHSMGIVFIALGASVLSLIFTSARNAHIVFAVFLVLSIGGTLVQPYMSGSDDTYSTAYKTMYFTKFLVGTLALYFISLYFQKQVNRIKENEKRVLQELDAAKTKFYTNMTHEFRTPLSMIMGWAEHIADDPGKHLKEGTGSIKRNGKKLLDLVNQLMEISKIEAGSLPLKPGFDDILRTVGTIIEEHRGVAALSGVKLHFVSDEESIMMDYDEEKIETILINLLSNSIKFTPSGGDVYVQADSIENTFVLKVRDTGPGIPREHLQHIFDRFYQVDDSATRKTGGSGIGLAITRGLVNLMNGSIDVRSVNGQGATFTVSIPITTTAQASHPSESARVPDETPVHYPLDDQNGEGHSELPLVLIVEDNADMLRFLSSILEDNYRILLAYDGIDGWSKAREHTPDLMISDIMMPGMDGYELCRKMKADIRTSHIPIILLTAKADLDSKIEGLELGAEAYLTKPFSKRELLVRIRKLFEMRQQLQERYRLATIDSAENGSSNHLPGRESAFLKQVRELIALNLDSPELTVSSMAAELNMSQSQLYRKLRSLTDYTPVQFIRRARLSRARQLLRDTDLSVGETSYHVGIEDPVYFTRLFKKEFGITPSEFRQQAVL